MLEIVGLDHIQLAMPPNREAEARQFYSGVLGLAEIAKPGPLAGRGGCWFAGPGTIVHLGVEQDFTPARKAHPCFQVADLAASRQALQAAEVKITPDDSIPWVRRLYIADPFGNRIELLQAGDTFQPVPEE